MKKSYKIIFLVIIFIFLSTFNPNKINFFSKKKDFFFKIKEIKIYNTVLIQENEIIEKLHDIYNKNILTIKSKDIAEPLKTVDFLDKIEVKKKYPNTIIVKIYETKPIAILFKKKTKYLFDNSSNLILLSEDMSYDDLPNVFGKGAESEFLNFFNLLESSDFPKKKIKNYYYHKIGRWDLELVDNKIIKLPNEKILEAIKKSSELLDRDDFKIYNVFDLRINGKIVVE